MLVAFSSTGGRSRTPNLLIRSQVLYPIELRPQHANTISNRHTIRDLRNENEPCFRHAIAAKMVLPSQRPKHSQAIPHQQVFGT